jgi:hypothetical protein
MIVYTAYDLAEAHIVAGRLEFEGIRALIQHQPGRGALGITYGNLGAIHIAVVPENYDDALAILSDEAATDEAEALPETTAPIYFRTGQSPNEVEAPDDESDEADADDRAARRQ